MASKNGAFRKRAMDAYVSVTIHHVMHVTYYARARHKTDSTDTTCGAHLVYIKQADQSTSRCGSHR